MVKSALLLGIIVFSLSSFHFARSEKKSKFNSAFLINFITLISYLLMYQSNIFTINLYGQPVYYTRWVFYALSCSLLMYEIAKKTKTSSAKTTQWIMLTIIVMLTGAYSAYITGMYKILFYTISSIAYVMLIKQVMSSLNKSTSYIKYYINFGWNIFPIVFVLTPAGVGMISAYIANLLYLSLDFYTKIVFSTKINS